MRNVLAYAILLYYIINHKFFEAKKGAMAPYDIDNSIFLFMDIINFQQFFQTLDPFFPCEQILHHQVNHHQ